MNGVKVTIYIALAFAVGALFPLLGLLAGAAAIGAAYASSRPQLPTQCDPALLEEIRDIEADIRRRLR